jgi:4-amino-4-deoxy-L-arabinose transferase-like glycosyltransferase
MRLRLESSAVRLGRPSFRRGALALAVLAGLHGLLYFPLVDTHEETDSWTYVAAGNAIRDAGYSTPLKAGFYYVYPDGWFDITGARVPRRVWDEPERQAFRPPGYPLYLSLFGEKKIVGADHTPALVGQCVLFALGALLLIATVRRWWGESTALLAGALYAIDPWSKHYVSLVLSETLAGAVAIAAAYAFTRAWQERVVGWWAAAGALAGALSLVRAVFVLAVPLIVLAAGVRSARARERASAVAVAAVAAGLLVGPWLAWTNDVVGRPTMAAWGEGFNLALAAGGEGRGKSSTQVEADPDFAARMSALRRIVPPAAELARYPTAHPRYLAEADTALRDDARELYAERLREEPHAVVLEAAYRMWFLWNAHADWYQPEGAALALLTALDWLLLALAVGGSALALRRGGAAAGVVVLLAVYTLVLGTHHVEARFGLPLRGLFLALVALAVFEATRPWHQRRSEEGA